MAKRKQKWNPKYNEKRSARRKKNKIRAFKLFGSKCKLCGISKPDIIEIYDFHHIDPKAKENEIANIWTSSWKNILVELDKCVMLCANCHRILHANKK